MWSALIWLKIMVSVNAVKSSNEFPSSASPPHSRCSNALQSGVTGPRITAGQDIFSFLNVSISNLGTGFLLGVKTARR